MLSRRQAALISPLLLGEFEDATSPDSNRITCMPEFDDRQGFADKENEGPTPRIKLFRTGNQKKRQPICGDKTVRHLIEFKPRAVELKPVTNNYHQGDDDEFKVKAAASILMLMRYVAAFDQKNMPTIAEPITMTTSDSPTIKMSAPSVDVHNLVLDDQTEERVGMLLAQPEDAQELNSLHCFVRSDLLELFVVQDGTSRGHVGLRCACCAHLPRKDRAGTVMTKFFPKSLRDIYRSVCTWQRVHFQQCRHVPKKVLRMYKALKADDKTRGKTKYWVESAKRMGLVDVGEGEREGIRFASLPNV
jgi:hypothetical protein